VTLPLHEAPDPHAMSHILAATSQPPLQADGHVGTVQ